jgi:hypothetical protein
VLDLEIVAVKCLDCEQMVWAGDDHPCWVEELGMRAFEAAMWKKWKEENAIEPVEPSEHIVPWSDAKEGDKLNTEAGQDCSLCPPDSQYKISEGCFVKEHPSCKECASAEWMSLKFAVREEF